LDRAVELNPNFADWRMPVVSDFLAGGKADSAINDCDQWLVRGP